MCDVAFSYYANKDSDFNYVDIDAHCEVLQRVIISLGRDVKRTSSSSQALNWVSPCLITGVQKRGGICVFDLHSHNFPREGITSSFAALASQPLAPRLVSSLPH